MPRFARMRPVLACAGDSGGHGSPASRGRLLQAQRLPDHSDRMFRAAYALCGSLHDAEDLVQETYARVLRRPRFVRRDDDLGYLLRALRNTWIAMHRGRTARPRDRAMAPAKQPLMCWTTSVGGQSAGKLARRVCSASTPPVEAPMTIASGRAWTGAGDGAGAESVRAGRAGAGANRTRAASRTIAGRASSSVPPWAIRSCDLGMQPTAPS